MGYEQQAKSYLEWEKQNIVIQRPPGTAISLEWKKDHYVGTIQQIVLEYDPKIVLLSKSSQPIHPELHQAILRLDQGRLQLKADDILDLEGRLHFLRRIGYRLTNLTARQMVYMATTPTSITDQIGQTTIKKQNHFYGEIDRR